MAKKTKRIDSLKNETSDPDGLKAFIKKSNERNKILQKLLNSINKSNNLNKSDKT